MGLGKMSVEYNMPRLGDEVEAISDVPNTF